MLVVWIKCHRSTERDKKWLWWQGSFLIYTSNNKKHQKFWMEKGSRFHEKKNSVVIWKSGDQTLRPHSLRRSHIQKRCQYKWVWYLSIKFYNRSVENEWYYTDCWLYMPNIDKSIRTYGIQCVIISITGMADHELCFFLVVRSACEISFFPYYIFLLDNGVLMPGQFIVYKL